MSADLAEREFSVDSVSSSVPPSETTESIQSSVRIITQRASAERMPPPPSRDSTPSGTRRRRNTSSAQKIEEQAHAERIQSMRRRIAELRQKKEEIGLAQELEMLETWESSLQVSAVIPEASRTVNADFAYAEPASLASNEYWLQVFRTSPYGPSVSSYRLSDELAYTEFLQSIGIQEKETITWKKGETEQYFMNKTNYQDFLMTREDKSLMRVHIENK